MTPNEGPLDALTPPGRQQPTAFPQAPPGASMVVTMQSPGWVLPSNRLGVMPPCRGQQCCVSSRRSLEKARAWSGRDGPPEPFMVKGYA